MKRIIAALSRVKSAGVCTACHLFGKYQIVVLLVLCCCGSAMALRWNTETVDSVGSGSVGKNPDIAVDANNRPHIAYRRDPVMPLFDVLKYARKDGSSWTINTVSSGGDDGYCASIDVTPAGIAHMAYMSTSPGMGFGYATGSVGAWSYGRIITDRIFYNQDATRTKVIPAGGVGILTRYLEDVSGSLQNRIGLATDTGSGWTFSSNAVTSTQYIDLAYDAAGVAHIVVSAGFSVKYTNSNQLWTWQDVQPDIYPISIQGVAIDLDENDSPCIAYSIGSTLYYARPTPTGWQPASTDIATTHAINSLQIDSAGITHVHAGNRYISGKGSQWRSQLIPSSGTEGHMAIDSANQAHVASYSSNSLKYSYGQIIPLLQIPNGDFELGETADWYEWGEQGSEGILQRAADIIEYPDSSGNHVCRLRAFDPWSNGQCSSYIQNDIDTPTDTDHVYLKFSYQFLATDCQLEVWLGGGYDPIVTITGPATPQTQMQSFYMKLPFVAGDITDTPLYFLLERQNSSSDDEEGYAFYLDDVAFATSPAADIDDNGIVDLNDFAQLAALWLTEGCGTCGRADLTGDGNVGIPDLYILGINWLKTP